MDKFPEAFNRYNSKETPRDRGINTFPELVQDFGRWQNRSTSSKQSKAMAKVSDTIGIKPYISINYIRYYKDKETKQTRYRDLSNGQFIKKEEYEKYVQE